MRFLKNILTPKEQKALLAVCGLALLGLLAGQAKSFITISGGEQLQEQQLLAVAVEEDVPVQIDIHTATKEELMLLPGIGEKRAQDIIDYRSIHGFKSTDGLLEIKGIGEKTLAKMLPSLVLFGKPKFTAEVMANPDAMTTIGLMEGNAAKGLDTSGAKPASKASRSESVPKSELTGIVNLNTAGLEELCTLPGIGETKAQAIIDFRGENGPFGSIDDITKVKGIGAKTLEKIRHRLAV
jgi:competence protein ComEA